MAPVEMDREGCSQGGGCPLGRGSSPEERGSPWRVSCPQESLPRETVSTGRGGATWGQASPRGRASLTSISPTILPPSQDPLPWATCPLNSNRTGYEEECEKTSSTQYFWYRQTLNISPSLEVSGAVQWEQALCLTLAWLVVYLCILRGTESTGKVRSNCRSW